jgi:hypothetical protein
MKAAGGDGSAGGIKEIMTHAQLPTNMHAIPKKCILER